VGEGVAGGFVGRAAHDLTLAVVMPAA
jgi:hypothetical protein